MFAPLPQRPYTILPDRPSSPDSTRSPREYVVWAVHTISKTTIQAVHWKQVVLNVVNADGKLTKREEVEMDYDDRVREIWFLPDGSEKRDSRDSKTVSYDVFLQLPIEEVCAVHVKMLNTLYSSSTMPP